MTDEEILVKYKDTIDSDIAQYCHDYGFTTELEKEKFSNKYKSNFVKGFKKGREEEKIEIATKMLQQGLDPKLISSATGLSNEQILSLKSKL